MRLKYFLPLYMNLPHGDGILIVAASLLFIIVAPQIRKKRKQVLTEGDGLRDIVRPKKRRGLRGVFLGRVGINYRRYR